MSIRDEELVQYLLGEADDALRQRIESALRDDAEVVRRIDELRFALGMLDSLRSVVEPPEDLVARTMARIDEDADVASTPDAANEAAKDQAAKDQAAGVPDARSLNNLVRLRPDVRPTEHRSSRSPWDSVIMSLSVGVIVCLLLPLVLHGRSLSRKHVCAYNQRTVGRALADLAQQSPEHRLPAVPVVGPLDFAGIYAVKLQDVGLLESQRPLRCVSLLDGDSSLNGQELMVVPTTAAFLQASPTQQAAWRAALGRNYAYNFGIIDEGRIAGPRLEGRSHLAILADAPLVEGDCDRFTAHDGRGINIYYEDGRVAFYYFPRRVVAPQSSSMHPAFGGTVVQVSNWHEAMDYPFRNLEGRQAHGLNANDASLGPSYSSPLPARLDTTE